LLSRTLITLAVSAGSLTYGQKEVFTATVTTDPPGGTTPTGGTVSFMEGSTRLGLAALVHGTATLATTALPVGPNVVTAAYSGSGDFGSSDTTTGTPMITSPVQMDAWAAPTFSVAEDSSGDFFISAYGPFEQDVLMDKGGTVSVFAGEGSNMSPVFTGPATDAGLGEPWGVAVYNGTVYFSDYFGGVVHAVNVSSDTMTTYAGTGGYGTGGGDGGPATDARLFGPAVLAVDRSGNLFIADYDNGIVQEVNAQTQDITTVAGNGTSGTSGDGALATSAELDQPSAVAVDSSGDIFIADTGNNVVREVKPGPDGLLMQGHEGTCACPMIAKLKIAAIAALCIGSLSRTFDGGGSHCH